jgi:hypothetical protein
MAYTPVPTVATGDLWSAANHNSYIRDNFAAGVPDIITAKGDLPVGLSVNAAGVLAIGANGQIPVANSAATLGIVWINRTGTLGAIIGNGTDAILPGWKLWTPEVPCNCNIVSARLFSDAPGSAVVDIWKSSFAGFPPTDANSITAAAPMTLSAAQKSEDTTLSGWTVALVKGDVLGFYVDSAATVKLLVVSLGIVKTAVS